MLVGYSVKLVSIIALYLYMYFENKRRDRAAMEGLNTAEEGIENGMLVRYLILLMHWWTLIWKAANVCRTKRRLIIRGSGTFYNLLRFWVNLVV